MPNFAKDDVAYPEEDIKQPNRLTAYGYKDDSTPTWTDYGKAVQSGTYDLAGYVAAGARLAGDEFGLDSLSKNSKDAQQEWHQASEETRAQMSDSARRRMEAALDDPDFYGHIISSVGLKGAQMAPSLVASVVPATIMSGAVATTAAAATVGASINTGAFVDQVQTSLDNTPDDQLAKQSPVYAKLLESNGGDKVKARAQYNNVVMGLMPVYVFGASFLAEAAGPSAQIARGVGGSAMELTGHTGWRAVLAGAGEAGAAGAVEQGAVAAGTQEAAVASGAQSEVDVGEIQRQALTGAVVGTALGGAIGTVGAVAGRGGKSPIPEVDTPPAGYKPGDAAATTPAGQRVIDTITNPEPIGGPPAAIEPPKTEASTAKPSTAAPDPSVVQQTQPKASRKRPDQKVVTPEGNTVQNPGNVNPEAVTATPANGFEKVNAVGMDAAVTQALTEPVKTPASAPIQQPAPRLQTPEATPTPPTPNVTVGEPARSVPEASVPLPPPEARTPDPTQQAPTAPPGTVPTALGPATPPVRIRDEPVSPAIRAAGENGGPATAPIAGRVDGVAEARTPTTPKPRILEDVRPDVVAQNRLISFQERERLLANQRQAVAEDRATSGEVVGRPLYGKEKAKREADTTIAQSLFEKHVPETDIIPTKPAEKAALKGRVDSIMAEAKDAGVKIPTKIDYEGANPTPNHLVWLREVADLQKAMNRKEGATQSQVQRFLIRERAAKGGDFEIMKSERRSEGDIAKRVGQRGVETVADTSRILSAREKAEGVGQVVESAGTAGTGAEAEPVQTVASATKRGSVRDERSEDKPASEVRKVNVSSLSPEEKARIIAAANRVVAEPKGESAPVPKSEAVKTLPPKVTEKVALAKKIAAEAKKVEAEPSPAQIEAGNYKKGHVEVQGIPVTIETAANMMRRGTDPNGRAWESRMPAGTHYGEIKRTGGADGDKVDVFLGPHPQSDFVLVMDQVDPFTKEFDEHKTFVGYRNVREAVEAYVKTHESQGPERIGALTPMTVKEFKEWLKTDTTKPKDDLEIAKEARDDMSATRGWDNTPPGVELSNEDIRKNGPVIPHSNGIRSTESFSATEALDRFAKPDSTKGLPGSLYPLLKNALKRALKFSDTSVHFVTDEDFAKLRGGEAGSAIAFYDSAKNQVIVRSIIRVTSDAHQAHAVMHELVHAATVGQLNAEYVAGTTKNPGSATYHLTALLLDVKKQLTERGELYNDLWGHGLQTPDRIYGLKNIREFVAEALSNNDFQNLLAKVNVSSDVATFLKLGEHQKVTFWKALVNTVRGVLGMPKDTYSALEATMSLSERLIYASREPHVEDAYLSSMAALRGTDVAPRTITPSVRSAADIMVRRREQEALQHGSTVENLQDHLEANIKDFIERKAKETTRSLGDPKLLRLRSMTDMAALAKSYFRGNSVRRVVDAIEAIRVSGGEIAKRADPIIHALVSAERKYQGTKAFEEMTAIMHDATMSGVHPDRPLSANTQLGKKSMAGYWGRRQHPELEARYNALPNDLKDIYQKSRKLFEDLHDANIKQSLENRVLKSLGYNDPGLADRIFNDKVTDADKAMLGEDYELVAEAMDFKKNTGPYFPLKRFGNYVVRGTYKMEAPTTPHQVVDANTFEFNSQAEAEKYVAASKLHADLDSYYVDSQTGSRYFLDEKGKEIPVLAQDTDAVRRWRVRVQDRHVEFFENRSDAEARKSELEGDGVSMEPVTMRRDDPRVAHGDMLSTHMDRLMKRIEGRDTFKNMPEFQQNEVRRAVEEASYGVLSSTRIQTSRMQRRYVEGASKDIIRATAEYSGSMAGYLARYQHQGELDAALREMNKEADRGGDPNTAMGRSQIRNEIMYRINQPNISASGSANNKWSQWRQRLMVTSFIGHLASPAYSLFNAAQPIMVTAPIVGARHGLGSTVAAMTKAYADIAAIKSFARGVIATGQRAADQLADTNTYVSDIMARISNPGERKMMNHLIKHGSIDADAGLEISKLVNRNTGDQWLSYFEGISRQLPLAVESVNRAVSALSAYRLEMKRTGGDHDKSVLYAQEIVESTQGIYANTNMPPVFSSPLASLTFQFKKYGHMIYSLLGQQIGKAIRNLEPGDRAEAIRALGYIAAAHVAMAGTVGLPTEPIKLILLGANLMGVTAFTMADFEEKERRLAVALLGKTGGEMATHGVTRGLPGGWAMDMSTRLGMQEFMTFGSPNSNSQGDIYQYLGQMLLGAPGGQVVNAVTGAGNIANGDVVKGMGQMVPVKLFSDAFKAYQLATEGKTTKSGRQAMSPASLPEAVIRLLGIQPERVAEAQEAQSSYYRNTGRERQQRLSFMDAYASAKPADRPKVWKKIQEWNKDLPPDSRLTFSALSGYVSSRSKETLTNTIGGMKITKQTKAIAERTKALYNQ
jgi:hypothetical protein